MMPSATYALFRTAILGRMQVVCSYKGYHRELCPHVLGHTEGEEKVLAFQFGGESSKGLPPGGEWRCLFLRQVRNPRLREGAWHAGSSHTRPQVCVEEVDLDVNR